MHPVGQDKRVALGLAVAEAVGDVIGIAAGGRLLLPVIGVGIVGNLKVVFTKLGVKAELVFRRLVADERDKAALGVGRVVVNGSYGGSEAVVGTTAWYASLTGRTLKTP